MKTAVEVLHPGIYENRWKTKYHFLDLKTKRTSRRNKFIVPWLDEWRK